MDGFQDTYGTVKVEIASSCEEEGSSGINIPESEFHGTTSRVKSPNNTEVTEHKLARKLIPIVTYKLGDQIVVTLPDVYEVVRNACGSCTSVQGTMGKLGVTASRFTPFELIRLKRLHGVNPGAKCCSYILVEEFERLLARLDEQYGHSCQALIEIQPSTVLDVARSPLSVSTDSRNSTAANTSSQPPSRPSRISTPVDMQRIHTFMLDDQVIVDYSEIQRSFEVLFNSSVSFDHCIARLAINSIAYTKDGDTSLMRLFVTQRDAHRMFQYAGALSNVDTTSVKWIKPRKLSSVDSSGGSGIRSRETQIRGDDSSQQEYRVHRSEETRLDISSSGNSPAFQRAQESAFGNTLKESPSASVTDTSVVPETMKGPVSVDTVSEFAIATSRADKLTRGPSQTVGASDVAGPSRCSRSCHTPDGSEIDTVEMPNDNNFAPFTIDVACDDEAPDYMGLGSILIIRTFQINDTIVVCIPDIHKAIISLYGQSVQVGYYMNRLNIITHRFSHTQVKQLKLHDVLSLKATVCTYILKSDAQKLIKMYDAINTVSKSENVQWAEPVVMEEMCFEQSRESNRDDVVQSESESACLQEFSQGPVRIPTFIIEEALVVSMPDAHKAVQILNGQSVQLRYNLEKLGIAKRKYSYSQVYQLKAFSDIKRPSMCTFILKSDVERLLKLYLTSEKMPRLNYIEWLPPVTLEDLNQIQSGQGEASGCQEGDTNSVSPESTEQEKTLEDEAQQIIIRQDQGTPVELGSSIVGQDTRKSSATSDTVMSESGVSAAHTGAVTTTQANGTASQDVSDPMTAGSSGTITAQGNTPLTHVVYQHIPHVTGRPQDAVMCTVHGRGMPVGAVHSQRANLIGSTQCVHLMQDHETRANTVSGMVCSSQKRLLEVSTEKEQLESTAKRLKADNEEHIKTVQRKETEMKILHDAYQHQVELERKKWEKAEKEAADLRTSNQELLKNLQRKESEMKILHDSYQLQILQEKEKKEKMEKQLNELRGTCSEDLNIAEMKKEL